MAYSKNVISYWLVGRDQKSFPLAWAADLLDDSANIIGESAAHGGRCADQDDAARQVAALAIHLNVAPDNVHFDPDSTAFFSNC